MTTRSSSITLEWADAEYVFRLPIKQLIELQEKCDAGPAHILSRLQQGAWRVEDVRETIRLGLIGGGLDAPKALKLTTRYVDDTPLFGNVLYAEAILSAAVLGVEDEPLEKKPLGAQQSDPLKEERSDGPPSSEAVLRPDYPSGT